jgi:signal transduction histidine kinase
VRLAAIERYDILDAPQEATFDRIVAIVAAVFDVSAALITFVDRDRSWYAAEKGMGKREMPRSDNMCDTVIRQDAVYVVNDASVAEEATVRPLLKAGLRFYAGVPLRTRDGIKIGTICAIDPRPREVTEREKEILRDLAEVVVDELELRIAARKIAEADEALRQLNTQLERVSRNKSSFLADLSHELRTPLNGILGASELLSQGVFGELNERQDEYVGDIRTSGEHLLRLINDVLDLNRIEAGQVDLESEAIPVNGLLQGCAALVRSLVSARALDLRVEAAPEGLTVAGDERRLTQVLCNLLSNAVKFSPEGGCIRLGASERELEVLFSVEDDGPGIAPEFQERIFEQFFRTATDREGTGLGLPLARRLVELHGGRIWVETSPGRGSRFAFTLPRALTSSARRQ